MRAAAILPLAPLAFAASPAIAQEVKPIVDTRLRYEAVDQAGIAARADALTMRVRAGIEAKSGDFAMLAESEATLALIDGYNSSVNGRTAYPVVADPQTVEINRLQLQYRGIADTVLTAGRQRIALDDHRFVGNVPWRQNEQTFDAVRLESKALGPVAVDVAYVWSARTIHGVDSPIAHIDGDNILAAASGRIGPVSISGFAYLIDQDAPSRRQFSSQTYGMRAVFSQRLGRANLQLTGSYARQSDWASNPDRYTADYWLAEAQLRHKRVTLIAGTEVLGADRGLANTSFQTPLATLHKFQGWADKFLTTPADGIRDYYAGGGYVLELAGVPPVTLQAVWHRFDSDRASRRYGDELDLQLSFKPAKQLSALIKYADYSARSFATDTRKLWLELDFIL